MTDIKKPIFFEKNRVRRIYTGGKQFATFFGDDSTEGYFPEEWVCSSVKALNEGSTVFNEGISKTESGDWFDELLKKYPEELLGQGRSELGVLVKFLDSSIRLPLQVHPDKAFARKHLNSDYGKTESWIILGTEEDACIYFGFNGKYTKEQLIKAFESDDDTELLSMMNRIPVSVGDVYLIPGRAIHAIGKGCLLLEVQEPTDFTIQPESRCGEYILSENEKFIGLKPDIAYDCFDMKLDSLEKTLKVSKCEPKKVGNTEQLITYEDTPCFAVNRYSPEGDGSVTLPAPAVYVVAEGSGELSCDGMHRTVKQGDYFFAPACTDGQITVSGNLKIIECCLPMK